MNVEGSVQVTPSCKRTLALEAYKAGLGSLRVMLLLCRVPFSPAGFYRRDSQWDHRLKVKGTHRHTYIDHSVLGAP